MSPITSRVIASLLMLSCVAFSSQEKICSCTEWRKQIIMNKRMSIYVKPNNEICRLLSVREVMKNSEEDKELYNLVTDHIRNLCKEMENTALNCDDLDGISPDDSSLMYTCYKQGISIFNSYSQSNVNKWEGGANCDKDKSDRYCRDSILKDVVLKRFVLTYP